MKKILALALALVLALSLGVTAFAAEVDLRSGTAGGSIIPKDDNITFNWIWDVFETEKKAYCRVAIDFRFEEDIDIYVCPNCVGRTLEDSTDASYEKWDGFWNERKGWDFDEDSFEVFAEGPFTYTVKEVTIEENEATEIDTQLQLKYKNVVYDMYEDGEFCYIKMSVEHEALEWYKFEKTDLKFVDAKDASLYELVDGAVLQKTAYDPTLSTTDGAVLYIAPREFPTWNHDMYRIRITPVDDYGVKVIRGSIYFKMIDYTSGITAKFQSAPLYLDFYHTDVFDDDVKDVAGEKKAMVLDNGMPYDNSFDCGKHDHEGGYSVFKYFTGLFVDDLYDYDFVYGYSEAQEPDVVSKEHFDEGVGKSLKITNLDYTWRLEMAKVAEYQPSVNFTFNSTVADVIKGAFPDAKFQAVNFLTPNDGVIYKTASKLYIKCDAKALAQKGEDTVYAYKYVGGVLEYQDAFEVNYYNTGDQYVYVELAAGESLGSYYLSDTDLRAAAPTEENPNTGANDVVGVAVALAVVSLVAAAAVSLKK